MKFDLKNFIIGFTVGIITVILFLFLIGNISIETEFDFGYKLKKIITLYI